MLVAGTWQPASPLLVHNRQGGSGEGLRDHRQRPRHDQHCVLTFALVWCCLPGVTNSPPQIGGLSCLPPQIILKTEDDEEKSVASVSAVLFFVLALQTGLTGMEGEKRFQQVRHLEPKIFQLIIDSDLQEPVPVADGSPPLHPLHGAAGLDVSLGQQE